ncbi:MAG: hypothetical protein LWY06_06765 [Firmicutes bacterium]|nr:hypothetical protein [Bacillota bacterium]
MVESIISILLMLLLAIFVFTTFPSIRMGLHLSQDHVNAAIIGRSLINDARKAGFDNITASSGTKTLSGTDNGAPYNQTYNYNFSSQTVAADKKVVWATVTWNESGKQKSVTVESIIVKI